MGRPINSRFFGAQDGANATLTVDVTAGAVTAVTVTDGGIGYTDGTGFTLLLATTAGGGDGAAEITYDVVAGVVGNASVSAPGTTYSDGAGQAVTDFPSTPSTGVQILGTAWIPGEGGAESVHILRQRSSRKFDVASDATPATHGICLTVDGPTPAEGEFVIPVEPSDGAGGSTGTEYARIITGRRVRTFQGNSYGWGDLVIDDLGEGGPGPDFPAV